jgi:hypothetical protein
VVSILRMKLGAVSVVYVRLVAQLLVHTGNTCFVVLPFADYSLDHSFALMIESSSGHAFVLTSLLVPTSLCQGSCCSIAALFGHVNFSFVTLLVPCDCV